jgi:hypothetical protein
MEWFLKPNTVLMVYFNQTRIRHSHIASLIAVKSHQYYGESIFLELKRNKIFHADICTHTHKKKNHVQFGEALVAIMLA